MSSYSKGRRKPEGGREGGREGETEEGREGGREEVGRDIPSEPRLTGRMMGADFWKSQLACIRRPSPEGGRGGGREGRKEG